MSLFEGEMSEGPTDIISQIGNACREMEEQALQAEEYFLAHLIRLVLLETERLSGPAQPSAPSVQPDV